MQAEMEYSFFTNGLDLLHDSAQLWDQRQPRTLHTCSDERSCLQKKKKYSLSVSLVLRLPEGLIEALGQEGLSRAS